MYHIEANKKKKKSLKNNIYQPCDLPVTISTFQFQYLSLQQILELLSVPQFVEVVSFLDSEAWNAIRISTKKVLYEEITKVVSKYLYL